MKPPLLWIVWFINGLLAMFYTLLDNVLVLVLIPPMVWLAITAKREQRTWIAATGAVAVLAAIVVPAPVPLIITLMAWAGSVAVRIDRFSPTTLRWRVNGGLALYGLAALGFAAYAAYTSRLSPTTWSNVVGGEAASIVSQGRSFLNVIAVWGLWIILPLGYLALLLQGILVHPPTSATPSEIIHTIRARGRDGLL